MAAGITAIGNSMASFYWIKLYHEILEDPKMALLPDRLWRRIIELFLLAGKHGKDGTIPNTRQLSWELRLNIDDLELDMRQIESTGVIQRITDGWVVTKFAERQAPSTNTERSKEYRKRQENTSATPSQRNVAQINRLTEERNVAETETEQNVAVAFVDISSLIMPMIAKVSGMASIPPKEMQRTEHLISMVQSYGLQETETALKSCSDRWRKTPRKNNSGCYSVTNMGWVDWAQDELVGKPAEKKLEDCVTVDEMIEWHNTHQQA